MAPAVLTWALPLIVFLTTFVFPKIEILGLRREPINLNADKCQVVPHLEACEDAWISQRHGLAYLPCSSIASRLAWTPAMGHYNSSALASLPLDHLTLLNLNDRSHFKLQLTGTPPDFPGIFVHAIDVIERPESDLLTIFINSHRPQRDAEIRGARSVIEVFQTDVGSREASWVRTIEHELVRTPNNLVALSPSSFYVSNDHARKTHWSRKLEMLYSESSEVVYCDFAGAEADCKIAANNLKYPNGIAKGPDGILYVGSSMGGGVTVFDTNQDHTLRQVGHLNLPRIIDNMHVNPLTGTLLVATIPFPLSFIKTMTPAGFAEGLIAPFEAWAVRNSTTGQGYTYEPVFASQSPSSSIATTCAPWGRNTLVVTGVMTKDVMICEVPGI